MKYDAGILWGHPDPSHIRELLILAHTPGVPLEWIYAAIGFGARRRKKLVAKIDCGDVDFLRQYQDLGRENAASVQPGDGWKMLQAVCPRYSGPVPLWSQLELQGDRRSDAAIARALGVDRKKVWRWRQNPVFHPLSGARLIPNRGFALPSPLAP